MVIGTAVDRAWRMAAALASVVGSFVADVSTSVRMTVDPQPTRKDRHMDGNASITIRAPQEEVVSRWRSFAQDADGSSRLGRIEIDDEEPDGAIRWHTSPDASAKASGVTRFVSAPGDRGTEIHIRIEFDVTGGVVGEAVKKVTGDEPQQLVRDDLRRLKQLIETGEIARSDGAPMGHSAKAQPEQRPAQPLEHAHG
jgi:hypothetical protein